MSAIPEALIPTVKQLIAEKYASKGYLKIGTTLTILTLSEIIAEIIDEKNISGYPDNLLFKLHYEDDDSWNSQLKMEHKYYIPGISADNIEIQIHYI